MKRTLLLILAGLAGLVLAVGVTVAAGELTSQRIGLESEPLEAGDELVPTTRATTRTQPGKTERERTRTTRTTRTEPERTTPPAVTTPPPVQTVPEIETDDDSGSGSDDDSGRGRGRGRGRGGDDDD